MALGESLSVVSIDEAWSDLRHHLDWTRGEGTLVFIATESRAQAGDLRERAALWAQRTGELWMQVPADDSAAPWLRRHLPQRGILWVELWDNAARLAVLHVLNEVRIRFARSGGGCLVLCGPFRLLEEAAREAADLWSIRSFAHAVRSVVHTRAGASDRIEEPSLSDDGYRSIWRVALPAEMRDERAAAVLRDVDRARALLSSDPVRARRFLDGSKNADSELARVLFGLVRAEIGGIFDDVVAVEANLSSALKRLAGFPSGFQVQVADAALSIGERFGAYDAAAAAAKESLGVRRGLADALGTPESRHDLSVSLSNVGRVAEARRDLDSAVRAYGEALEIVQELSKILNDPEVRRSLAKLWSDIGWIAYERDDFYGAEWDLSESLRVRLELDEELKTLETCRDVAGAWDSVGWVAIDSGNYELAEEAYRKSLNVKRHLANAEKSPEALLDLATAIDTLVYNISDPSEKVKLLAEKCKIMNDIDCGSAQ